MDKKVLFAIKGLNKVFRLGKKETVYALRDVNLEIFSGEYLSIMGPSGSGKTTLFNMIGALDRPTSGQTVVDEHIDLRKLSRRELAYFRCSHIGYVFQAYNLLYAYSAIDNVSMPLMFGGWDESKAVERAKEVLTEVGLGHRMTHRPDELSGGQQQRVAVARALANNPSIILADEPTANLDQETGLDIIKLLNRLTREHGVTVVTATHDHKMLDLSDRIVWIKDGTIDKVQLRSEVNIRVGKVG